MTKANARAGFTLVEVLVVLVVTAFLVSGAIVLFSSGYRDRAVEEAAGRVAADLAYARTQAIASHIEHLVVFDETGDGYVLLAEGDTLLHPVTKRPFAVDLGIAFQGAGVGLVSADFGGSDTLRFDEDGVPASGGQVALQAGDTNWSVTVARITGRITPAETP